MSKTTLSVKVWTGFSTMHEEILRPKLASRIEKLIGTKVELYHRVEGRYTLALRQNN
jgi:plasmid maintenance system antidote protein VapI